MGKVKGRKQKRLFVLDVGCAGKISEKDALDEVGINCKVEIASEVDERLAKFSTRKHTPSHMFANIGAVGDGKEFCIVCFSFHMANFSMLVLAVLEYNNPEIKQPPKTAVD